MAIDLDYLAKAYFYFDEPVPYNLDEEHIIYIRPISVRDSQFFLDSVDLLTVDKNSLPDPVIIQMSYLQFILDVLLQGDMKKVNQMLYKSFDFVSALSYPMMFGLAAISLTLAPQYYGSGYEPVGPAMMIESIVILIIAWSNVLGVQYLLPIHHQRDFTVSVTVGAFVNIILNIPLIRTWGLYGAMWSTVISEISVTLYQLWAVRGLLSYKILFSNSWKYLLAGTIMFIPVFCMNQNLKDNWLMMGVEVIVGIIVYGLMVFILKAPIISQAKELIRNKIGIKNNKARKN